MSTYTYDLFISFAPDDEAWVLGYLLPALHLPAERLISRTIFDLTQSFTLGVPAVAEFDRAVRSSRYTLLVLTPAYQADRQAEFGAMLAAHLSAETGEPRVLPLLLKPCALPLHVDFLVKLDCTDEAQRPAQIEQLRQRLGSPPAPAEELPCPYPGMVPFSAKDARFFCGREGEIDTLLRRLRDQRCLYVVGPSGSGKSSLVAAGVLPRLAGSEWFATDPFLVRALRPGAHPFEALSQELGGDPQQPATLLAHLFANPPHRRLLLFIDQLEEVFTSVERAERERFLAALVALRQRPECTLLIALRADFYPELMESALWPITEGAQLQIAPLRGEALLEAIRKPAQELGVYLEAGLLERLLADAAQEPGVLPLVQETMALLWEKREQKLLTLRSYERLGSEGRSGLAVAVAGKADATLAALTPEQQRMARRMLLRLVQFGEGRPDTRRQQALAALRAGEDEALFQQVLGHLVEHRLLTVSSAGKQSREPLVDLSHEALLSGWPELRCWIDERREAEKRRRWLEDKVTEWRATGSVLDGVELGLAQRYVDSADGKELGHSAALVELMQASAEALKTERKLQEAAQKFVHKTDQAALAACVERGRQELLAGHPERAALWLQRAYQGGYEEEATALRALLAHALRPLDGLKASPLLATLEGHKRPIWVVAYSPDGTRVLTGSHDHTARLWDARSGALLSSLEGHQGELWRAIFSPDGARALTGSEDKTAKLWDARSGQLLFSLEGHQTTVGVLAFSPDGTRVLTGAADGVAKLWDARSGALLFSLVGEHDGLTAGMFSPDGARVLTTSYNKTVQWEVQSGAQLSSVDRDPDTASAWVFSPDGSSVLTTDARQTARLWDTRSGQLLAALKGRQDDVAAAAFSPDGARLCIGGAEGSVTLWEAQSGLLLATLEGHQAAVPAVAFSPDGARLLTGSHDFTAKLWDVLSGELLCSLEGHRGLVGAVAFSPDGARVLTGSMDKRAMLWDVHLETRSPAEVEALIRGRSLFKLEGDRIVPATPEQSP